jgi:hypothetical protein
MKRLRTAFMWQMYWQQTMRQQTQPRQDMLIDCPTISAESFTDGATPTEKPLSAMSMPMLAPHPISHTEQPIFTPPAVEGTMLDFSDARFDFHPNSTSIPTVMLSNGPRAVIDPSQISSLPQHITFVPLLASPTGSGMEPTEADFLHMAESNLPRHLHANAFLSDPALRQRRRKRSFQDTTFTCPFDECGVRFTDQLEFSKHIHSHSFMAMIDDITASTSNEIDAAGGLVGMHLPGLAIPRPAKSLKSPKPYKSRARRSAPLDPNVERPFACSFEACGTRV